MKDFNIQINFQFLILVATILSACRLQSKIQTSTENPSPIMPSPTCCTTPTPFPLYPTVVLQTDEKVNALAINQHDNNQFAIGTDNGIRTYEFTITATNVTIAEQWSVPSDNKVLSVRFSPDGQILAAGYDNGDIVLIDAALGDTTTTLHSEDGLASSIRFNTSGSLIACGGCNWNFGLWNISTQPSFSVFPAQHLGLINDVVWSPDETLIATASVDTTILIWDINTQEVKQVLEVGDPGWDASVESLAWSPDGSVLASGGGDTVVTLWNMFNNADVLGVLAGNKGSIKAILWSPDGESLISAAYGPLFLWDMDTYEPTLMECHTNWVTSLDMTPDGEFLLSGGWDGKIAVWKMP